MFVFRSGRGRNPASTESGCLPREAESLRVFGGATSATVGVAGGATKAVTQTESAAVRRDGANVAWLAGLRRDAAAAISGRPVNKKAAGILGGLKISPLRTSFKRWAVLAGPANRSRPFNKSALHARRRSLRPYARTCPPACRPL